MLGCVTDRQFHAFFERAQALVRVVGHHVEYGPLGVAHPTTRVAAFLVNRARAEATRAPVARRGQLVGGRDSS